jgi:Zn-dependent peptidase ImmA (M78 family)
MKPGKEISGWEMVIKGLGHIWGPGAEALQLQKDLGVESLEETTAAARRAGYEVCYADLPDSVDGFAEIIEGKPHIVLNRAKSQQNLLYTLPHELGHHVLHLNPSREPDQLELSIKDNAELEAHMFATGWVMFLANDKQRWDVLNENPEPRIVLTMSVFVSLLMILAGLFLHLWSRPTKTK